MTSTVTVDLPAEIFDVELNVPLVHQVVVAQLAAARQGTHSTKRRGEVSGGGKKPYRQKGTGRARQGSTRAPQFAGGGVVHGPKPRDYSQRTPKKMKAAALRVPCRTGPATAACTSSTRSPRDPLDQGALAAIKAVTERKNVLVVLAAMRSTRGSRCATSPRSTCCTPTS
jgi:large subunit ribosomal protein L4